MKNNDFLMQDEIENFLEQEDFHQIILLFNTLPAKNVRRALYLLSEVFPNKIEISESQFGFIKYILSDNKFLNVQSISDFIRAISIVDFNNFQKKEVTELIFSKLNQLSKNCDFELNLLITKLIDHHEFFDYLEKFKGDFNETSKKYLSNFILFEKEYFGDNYTEDEMSNLMSLIR